MGHWHREEELAEEKCCKHSVELPWTLSIHCLGANRITATFSYFATMLCDALRHTETITEELVGIFAMVGVPQQILTDQGAHFQSEFLQDIYYLLHFNVPTTTRQMDWWRNLTKGMLCKCPTKDGKD